MAGSKEIRTKIKSVENTRKITKAMEMVAASKMRKAQERMTAARPYAEKIRAVAAHLSHAQSEYKHPFLIQRENVKNIGIIIVTSDKGLCGGLNTNVLRSSISQIKDWEKAGKKVQVSAIGNKAISFMGRVGANIKSQVSGMGDTPHMEDLLGAVKVMLDSFTNGEIDQLHICYTKFINTMKQEPNMEQLLPLSGDKSETPETTWDYIYEPDATLVIDALLSRYIETLIYHGVAENMASEQSSRMVAMKAASDNAGNVIDELTLVYNKARQAAITKEISEIVGGAAAVS
ncbi:F0F1 ATP synthase subunit gamma [Methylophilaceae bacterium]|jgi:F-type H+-transporting ATPase subunit gamma|nr:F0F1 ATP synthase subunit gamma [Methylophilaceae bacterium]|tara:strand:- start:1222 stop:2088 length:867 start_codon:yes stop_codon:yes gene_type:complete